MNRWQETWLAPAWVVFLVIVACVGLTKGADWLPFASPYKRHLAAGMLQLVLLTLTVGYLAAWWAGHLCGSGIEAWPRGAWLAVSAGIVLYAAGLSYLSLVRHRALLTGIWDLGYYAQITWELSQMEIPRSTIWAGALWGNHATFILIAVAPFLWLFPGPATLLVIQSIVLALGALPVFYLGRRIWGDPLSGAVFAGAYLLYPPLQFMNLFDFHADIFATPILLAAFAALFAGRIGWAVVWAGLVILVKEDMALVSAAFGLYVAVVHRRRRGLALAAIATVAFALLIWVIIPTWIRAPYFFTFNRWPHLGESVWEIIGSPVLRPATFFGTLLQPERLGYLALLVAPLAGLPLFAPEILAVGLPPLASNLLSGIEMQYTIRGHYTATLTPILIAASIVGGRRVGTWIAQRGWRPSAVWAGVAATSVVASLAFSPLPWSQDPFAKKQFWDVTPRHGLSAVTAHIPDDASVSAANHLGAHVAFRRTLQFFPNGADTADFVLIDVGGLDYFGPSPNPEAFRVPLRRLVETRPLVTLVDHLALFGRGKPAPEETIARLVNLRTEKGGGTRPAGVFALVAGSVVPSRLVPREYVHSQYTWETRLRGRGMPCIEERLVTAGGAPVWENRRPLFHALLTSERWQAGWIADDVAANVLPETVLPGRYAWVVLTWDDVGGAECRNRPHAMTGLVVAEVTVLPW